MTGYLAHGLLTADKDLAVILTNNPNPAQAEFELENKNELLSTPKYFVHGDFAGHDQIDVQICELNHKHAESLIGENEYGFFYVDVDIYESETKMEIRDRNYKLEHLSMKLQEQIYQMSCDMAEDKAKYIHY